MSGFKWIEETREKNPDESMVDEEELTLFN
jgi:hypothetical protein